MVSREKKNLDLERLKNIMFLINDLAYGGAEVQVVELAKRLKERGWSVSFVSMLPPEAFVEELRNQRIPIHSLRMRRGVPDPRAILRLRRVFLKKSRL